MLMRGSGAEALLEYCPLGEERAKYDSSENEPILLGHQSYIALAVEQYSFDGRAI